MSQSYLDNEEIKIDRYDLFYVLSIIFISILLRVYKLNEQSIWFDEYVVIGNAKYLSHLEYLKILYLNSPDYGISPASPLILYLWINIFPDIDWFWRLLPISVGVLTILLTYLFARDIYGKKIAFFTCLLFSFSPFNIWFHQELKCYVFLQFLSVLSFYCLWKYFNSKNRDWWWCGIVFLSNMAMPWFHAIYIITPLVQIPILTLGFRQSQRIKKIIWSCMCLLSIVPWCIWYITLSPFMFNIMDNYEEKLGISVLVHRLFGIDCVRISEHLLPAWKTNIFAVSNPILRLIINNLLLFDILVVGIFITSILFFVLDFIWKWRKKKIHENRFEIYLFLICSVQPVLLLLISVVLKKPVFQSLYFYFIFPMLYILVISEIFKLKPLKFSYVVIVILLIAYTTQCFSFITFKNRTDYRRAIKFLEENAGLGDVVLGQRITSFWDIGKVYMKRNDLKYQSYYSLFGAFELAKKNLEENKDNRIWVIIEPLTLYAIYNCDPVAKLTECFNNNGLDVYWKSYPGHYNLYIGQIAKNFRTDANKKCDNLVNPHVNYEKLLDILHIEYKDDMEKEKYEHILKKYIAYWPIVSWINIFMIAEMLKDRHIDVAEKICDYLMTRYPQFGDIYLIKYVICKNINNRNDCDKYLQLAYNKKRNLEEFYLIEKNLLMKKNDVYFNNKYKLCVFPISEFLYYPMLEE